MRILTASLSHETNTFCRRLTGLGDFGRLPPGPALPGGEAVIRLFAGTATVLGGILDRAVELGLDVEPIYRVEAPPGGRVEDDAFEHLADLLLNRIAEHEAWDALLLECHGAMATESLDDAEGELLRRIRERFGTERPIAVVVDFHANVSPLMAHHADALLGFDCYPHTDRRSRGIEALELLYRCVAEGLRPRLAFRQVPLLTMPPRQCTDLEPMCRLLPQLWEIEQRPGILAATIALGTAFADVADAGATVTVVGEDPEAAERAAGELARALWAARNEFEVDLVPVDAVIRYAAQRASGTVLLADGADNPGGGGPCDETEILEALIDADARDAVVAVIADPETSLQAHDAGVGSTILARIGGKSPDSQSSPVSAEAYVKHLSDGRFEYQTDLSAGIEGFLGPTAVLEIGGVTLIVTTERVQVLDPEILRCVGVEPTEQRLLALKSAVHYRHAFSEFAERIFDADTSGVHRPTFEGRDYHRLRRPIYPLDPETNFSAE